MEWRIVFEEAFITVVKGKRTHAVEDAAATVEKQRCVAVALQDAGDSFNVVGKVAFNDGITGQGRKGSKDAFHSAHGPISAGVDIGEEEAFVGGEFVHFRRQGWLFASETTQNSEPRLSSRKMTTFK